jgi:DNA-binding response OmpR family regulator
MSFAPVTTPPWSPDHSADTEHVFSMRILYVDDEPSLRKFGELVLGKSGFIVDTVPDGEEAWEALNAREYHLLITDNHMPNLTGLELIAKVNASGLRLPIILASSIVGALTSGDSRLLDCGALLAKPFTPKQLVSLVRSLLQEKFSPTNSAAA